MHSTLLNTGNLQLFRETLLSWFDEAHRDFPWRHTNDPYEILVAEKLLQQTLARTSVVEAYNTIIVQYSNVFSLSEANLATLQSVIAPLGLKYRATELINLAKQIVDEYDGVIPNDLKKLLQLNGVGEYCARAVLSFGFGENIAIVDTNVARLFYRLFEIAGSLPPNPARKKSLIEMAENLIPPGNTKSFNLAILDLCALICKPKNPTCNICPVQKYCMYGDKN